MTLYALPRSGGWSSWLFIMSKRIRKIRTPVKLNYPFSIGTNIVALSSNPYSVTDSSMVCEVVFAFTRKETAENIKSKKLSPSRITISKIVKLVGPGAVGTDIVVRTIAKLNKNGTYVPIQYYWVESKFFRKITEKEATETFDIPF